MFEDWSFSQTHDLQEMSSRVQRMKDILSAIDSGDFGKDRESTAVLVSYCKSLVNGQRASLGRTKPGSWSVAPNDDGMPSDARVDFIFMPTYIAVSILSRVLLDFPWVAIQIPRYLISLKRGLNFCTYRKLRGFGYDAIHGMLDAFVILAIGKVPILLEVAPEISPRLRELLGDLEVYLKDSLLKGETVGYWGTDLTSGYQNALETLYLYRDKDLRNSIGEPGNDIPSGYQGALETLYLYRDKDLMDSIKKNRATATEEFDKELPW